jgi:hypothetical protein
MIRALALFSVAALMVGLVAAQGCSGDGTATVGGPIGNSESAGTSISSSSAGGHTTDPMSSSTGAAGSDADLSGSGGGSSSGGDAAHGGGGLAGSSNGMSGSNAPAGASGVGGSTGAGGHAGASGSGGHAGTPGAGGAGGGSASGCDAPGLTWKTGSKTNFTSYPDPGSEECIKYSGCMYEGQFAACNKTEPVSWVMSHNIVAAFPDFTSLKLHDLCLKSGSKTIVVTVLDTCGDNDCSGCCTKNKGNADELIDVESFTNARWGVPDGRIQWADLGPTKGMGCQ